MRGAIEVRANWDRREPPSEITVRELRQAGSALDEDGSQSVALQLSGHLQEQRPILYLPETVAWEMLVPAPAGLAPGDRWTDTHDFHSVPLDSVQEHFGGVWRYEVEWACVPEECAAVVSQMESSPNPVLRETAAVGRWVQNPSSGASALESEWEGGPTHLREAVRYARGIGAQWPAAPKATMPEAGADWREWRRWMGGEVRFETSHRRALAVYQERTGRDPLADLVGRWDDRMDYVGPTAPMRHAAECLTSGSVRSPRAEPLRAHSLGSCGLSPSLPPVGTYRRRRSAPGRRGPGLPQERPIRSRSPRRRGRGCS